MVSTISITTLLLLIVPGINITANRLFGPPPRTRTYVCVWEISLGSVKALFSILEARIALAVLDAFRTNYTDLANAPAGEFSVPADPDCKQYMYWACLDLLYI